MKRLVAASIFALVLAACQTVPQPPDVADVLAIACPPVQVALSVLAVPGALDPAVEADIAVAAPLVAAVCEARKTVRLDDLHALTATALPAVSRIAQASPLDQEQKQAVVLGVAVAQAALTPLIGGRQ